MSGIMNNTARQFNLKCMTKTGSRVVVRIAPGFNVVDDNHWLAFVSKDGKKVDPYVAELKKKGFIEFGSKIDDMELELSPDTQAKSKSEPVSKAVIEKSAELVIAENEAEGAKAEAAKAKEEAAKAKEEAAKAKEEAAKAKEEAEAAKAEAAKAKPAK